MSALDAEYGGAVARPLIVTLRIDQRAQATFDEQRRRHFPPGRTVVGAHVTLFHALPGGEESALAKTLAATAQATTPFSVQVGEPVSLGNGVAFPLRSVALEALHRELQQLWWSCLTRQDRQGYRPHVTVQNKVSAESARRTLAVLRDAFEPASCAALGLDLWRYDGGAWTIRGTHWFGGLRRR